MRIGILVNHAAELHPEQTTSMLLHRAADRGYDSFLVEVGTLGQATDGVVMGRGRAIRAARDPGGVLLNLGPSRPLDLDGLDLILVRTNPARDPRTWAHQAALALLRLLPERGVRVVNDPQALVWATSKLHLSTLPAALRPRTLVSADADRLRAFVEEAPGDVVLKPTEGTRGRDVFRVGPTTGNLPQILDVLTRQGMAMAQDYVAEAVDGDVRLILLDGDLLEIDGRAAAVRRVPPATDFRSNVAVGGQAAPVRKVTPVMRRVAREAGAVLRSQGLRVAGLDLVGDRVVEMNVFSPGGLFDAQQHHGVDFVGAILDALVQPA